MEPSGRYTKVQRHRSGIFRCGTATMLLCAAMTWQAPGALAQDAAGYPSKPVRMLVPFPPGGAPDTIARVLGQRLSDDLGQPFIVENRAGAAGALAADATAKAAPDGYTLCVCTPVHWGILPALDKNLSYKPERDFQAVSMLARAANFLVVHESLKVTNLRELIALAKSNPGKLNFGSTGNGSMHHLITETLSGQTGISMLHVPYKGGSEVVNALVSGQIGLAFQALPSVAAQVKLGRVRVIAVALSQRTSLAGDVPTFAELGVEGMDFPGDFAAVVPAATPIQVVRRLSAAIGTALRQPEIAARLRPFAMEPIPSTPEVAAARLRQDFEKYEKAAQLIGLKR